MSSFKKFSKTHTAPGKDGSGGKRKDAPTPENPPKPDAPATQPNAARAKAMGHYGISWVPVDYYHYGVFRYTNLEDAIAQAKRDGQR